MSSLFLCQHSFDSFVSLCCKFIKGSSTSQALTPKARPLTIKNRAVSRASALMFSVWNRHEGATRLLLDAGANIEVVDSQGITSLMKAAWQGACGITRMLLERGADPQQITSYGWSALHSACHGNCEVCCDLLLACGASPLAETQGRWLPLHEATQMGASVGVIGALLDAAPLTIKMECHGNRTPLALNLEFKGGVDVLKLLLKRGSNPNERGTRQPFDTPLSLAVKYAHPTAIRPLLEAGADPEALVKGLNPLQAALRMGVTDVILELLFA